MGDLLQSLEMKRHGEIRDFRSARHGPRCWRRWRARNILILAIVFMAISFFAFMTLVRNGGPELRGSGLGREPRVRNHPGAAGAEGTRRRAALVGAGLVAVGVCLLARDLRRSRSRAIAAAYQVFAMIACVSVRKKPRQTGQRDSGSLGRFRF